MTPMQSEIAKLPHKAFTFLPVTAENQKAAQTAVKKFAKGCSVDDIVAFYDYTIMGNGKKGIIVTKDRLYASTLKGCIEFSKIEKIEPYSSNNYYCQVTFKDGTSVKFDSMGVASYPVGVVKIVMRYFKPEASTVQSVRTVPERTAPKSAQKVSQLDVSVKLPVIEEVNPQYEPIFESVYVEQPKPKAEDMSVVTRRPKPKVRQQPDEQE